MSSVIVYGENAPIGKMKIIKADTPLQPANFYGDSKKRAEEGLFQLQTSPHYGKKVSEENAYSGCSYVLTEKDKHVDEFKVVILRLPVIYGKGSKGNYPKLSYLAQRLPFFPKVSSHRSMLYITNLCEFIRLMIDNEEDGVFYPQNREYMNTSKMVRAIGAVHRRRVVLVPGFTPILRIGSHVLPAVNKAFGNLVIDKSLSRYKDDYQIVSAVESIRETESG